MNRAELKELSKQQIKGKIGVLFVITLLLIVISVVGSIVLSLVPFVGGIASLVLIGSPMALGMVMIYLNVAANLDIQVLDLFNGYEDLWSAFKVQFLAGLFTGLWTLLFIIPGIIKGISYSMSMYILAENKGMSALEAINRSKAMMEGHKMDYFVLNLSFIGWILLTYFTLGIAGIWVVPYMSTTITNFYNRIKEEPIYETVI